MVDESYNIHLNMLLFEVKGRANDHVEQLKILKRCGSMSGFSAEHFFKMGLAASESREPGIEVATTSFRMCLTLAVGAPGTDYRVVAAVIRKMIILANSRCKDGSDVSINSVLYSLHDRAARTNMYPSMSSK